MLILILLLLMINYRQVRLVLVTNATVTVLESETLLRGELTAQPDSGVRAREAHLSHHRDWLRLRLSTIDVRSGGTRTLALM